MMIMDGSDQAAVLALHDEVAYADLGTVTPELMITRQRATLVLVTSPTRSALDVAQDWSNWSWVNAPPRRAA